MRTLAERAAAPTRGELTRARLIAAARTIFERDGYVDARLTDITAAAGCATGSFYTHFGDKAEVLSAVLDLVRDDMLHPAEMALFAGGSLREHIGASNRAYLEAYRRNARIMKVLDQVAAIDPVFREVRRRRTDAFVSRNARAIAELQEAGLADAELDPTVAAKALSAMVSRLAFHTFCFEEEIEMDVLVSTCTTLWVNALGLRGA